MSWPCSPVDDGRGAELEERGERHPDEEGRPAHHEDPHHDPHRPRRGRLPLPVLNGRKVTRKFTQPFTNSHHLLAAPLLGPRRGEARRDGLRPRPLRLLQLQGDVARAQLVAGVRRGRQRQHLRLKSK